MYIQLIKVGCVIFQVLGPVYYHCLQMHPRFNTDINSKIKSSLSLDILRARTGSVSYSGRDWLLKGLLPPGSAVPPPRSRRTAGLDLTTPPADLHLLR